jgi:hypothetical protein
MDGLCCIYVAYEVPVQSVVSVLRYMELNTVLCKLKVFFFRQRSSIVFISVLSSKLCFV